jgi:DNA (cytosine-5)-methyltransferase 1
VDIINKAPTALSICPGIRGLERGVERVVGKLHVLAYVEIEAFIIENLVAAMDAGFLDAAPIWTDVKTLPAHLFRGKVDWLLGGYPCQPFSVAGKQQGELDPRHLWPFIEKHVDVIRPGGCFFENVPGHLNLGYREVRQSLEAMGYTVKEGIFSAEEVGAPQERKRLFILALDNSNSINRQLSECQQGQEWNKQGHRFNTEGTSEELGNTEGFSEREQTDKTKSLTADGQARREPVESGFEELADSGSSRSEIGFSGSDKWKEGESGITYDNRGQDKFPAGQGEYQHYWEEPRTVEPGMGCTIDGYNFREDLLRAFGNSVVEQTAELAFRTLLNEHMKVFLSLT